MYWRDQVSKTLTDLPAFRIRSLPMQDRYVAYALPTLKMPQLSSHFATPFFLVSLPIQELHIKLLGLSQLTNLAQLRPLSA